MSRARSAQASLLASVIDLGRAARVVRRPRSTRCTAAAIVGWRARDMPGRVALVTAERTLTWAELDAAISAPDPVTDGVVAALAQSRRSGGHVVTRTSGTTGPSRAVRRRVGPSGALQLIGLLGRLPLRGVGTVASLAPVAHGHGFGAFVAAAAVGATFVDLAGASGAQADRLLGAHPVDLLTGVPLQLERLATRAPAVRIPCIVSGSDHLDPALATRLATVFGAEVWNCYGLTEAGTVTVASPGDLRRHPGTVGRPLPGVRITELADGRLEVRAPLAARPVALDRGHLVDSLVFVTGRADGRINSGGELVDPDVLRAELVRLPGVVSVDLIPVDRRESAGLHRFDALVAVEPTATLDAETVRTRLRQRLGEGHVPRRVTLIHQPADPQ